MADAAGTRNLMRRRTLRSGGRSWLTGLFLLIVAVATGGCERSPTEAGAPPAGGSTARSPTVASLSPALTDILIGMGAADHLVAVSNYDAGKAGPQGLPTIGDYFNADWDRLSQLRP